MEFLLDLSTLSVVLGLLVLDEFLFCPSLLDGAALGTLIWESVWGTWLLEGLGLGFVDLSTVEDAVSTIISVEEFVELLDVAGSWGVGVAVDTGSVMGSLELDALLV